MLVKVGNAILSDEYLSIIEQLLLHFDDMRYLSIGYNYITFMLGNEVKGESWQQLLSEQRAAYYEINKVVGGVVMPQCQYS